MYFLKFLYYELTCNVIVLKVCCLLGRLFIPWVLCTGAVVLDWFVHCCECISNLFDDVASLFGRM